MKLLQIENTVFEKKNLVCRINRRLGTKEEKKKNSELEDLEIKPIQNEIQRKKITEQKKPNRAAVTCRMILSSLPYMSLASQGKEREEGNNNLFE